MPSPFSLRFYSKVGELRPIAVPYLTRREAENHFFLGTMGEADDDQQATGLTIHQNGELIGCGLVPPKWNLMLSRCGPEASRRVATELARRQITLRGILAPEADGDIFARQWNELTGAPTTFSMRMGVYELEQVIPPERPAAGHMRQATHEHFELWTQWVDAFGKWVNSPYDDPRKVAQDGLDAGRFYLWHDPDPVSMAAFKGETPSGAHILLVYTPENHRGHGYASSCVADLSRELLGRGMSTLFLNTQMNNPTSNSIYQRIGYRMMSMAVEHRF